MANDRGNTRRVLRLFYPLFPVISSLFCAPLGSQRASAISVGKACTRTAQPLACGRWPPGTPLFLR